MACIFRKGPAMLLGAQSVSGYRKGHGYQTVWLGQTQDGQPLRWRVLARQSPGEGFRDKDGQLFGGRPLLLLSDYLLGNHPASGQIRRDGYLTFHRQPDPAQAQANPASVWQNSDARRWCLQFAKSCLSPVEQDALLATFQSDPAYRPWRDSHDSALPPIPAAPDILRGDRVFFLSAEQAERRDYGFRRKRSYTAEQEWWTRSFEQIFCGSVEVSIVLTHFGGLLGSPTTMHFFARPAMNLDPSRVLLISGQGAKPRSAPRDTALLPPIPPVKGRKAPWKLTLLDDSRRGFSLGKPRRMGDVLTIPYRNAPVFNLEHAPNERLSALVMGANRLLTHYGNIALPLSPHGEVRLSLPQLKRGDRLFLLSEQCNGEERTDFSSPLHEVEIPD